MRLKLRRNLWSEKDRATFLPLWSWWLQPITLVFLYSLALVLFFLPGTAVSLACAARLKLRTENVLIVTVISTATFGYIAFWIYLGSKLAGEVFSFSLTFAAAVVVVLSLTRTPRVKTLVRELVRPVGYLFIAGLCYLSLFFTL